MVHLMKKVIIGFFAIAIILALIVYVPIRFYEISGYYRWTEEAKNAKIVCSNKTFSLEKQYTSVIASGNVMNCTKTPLQINENEIIIYCQNLSTNETYAYKNESTYTIEPQEETKISITIYKGAMTTESSTQASEIVEKCRIIKIEYQVGNNTYELKTIEQTHSKYIPLGTFIAAPIITALIIIATIIIFSSKKETAETGYSVKLKNLSFKKKLLIFLLFLIIFLTPIIVGIIPLYDGRWSATTFIVVSTLMGIGILVDLILICLQTAKRIVDDKTIILRNKVLSILTQSLQEKRKEIQEAQNHVQIAEDTAQKKERETTSELHDSIQAAQDKITKYEQQISKNSIEISMCEQRIATLRGKALEATKIASELEFRKICSLDGWEFEKYCAELFRLLGHSVKITKGSGDYGADLILDNSTSVQCKLYSNPVGLRALQEVYSSMAKYKTNRACVITNSTFTKQAIDYSRMANIELIDYGKLRKMVEYVLEQSGKTTNEIESEIATSQASICELKGQIQKLSVKIEQEKTKIFNLRIEINSSKEVQEIHESLKNFKDEVKRKIKILSEEAHSLDADISSLETLDFKQTMRIGGKYHIL